MPEPILQALNDKPSIGESALAAIASVIVPAHNEALTIGRCLASLLRSARFGEFEILVICNGCTDSTAAAARAFGGFVRVLEMEEASKIAAINLGNKLAKATPRIFVDADLEVTTDSLRDLAAALADDRYLAAVGHVTLDISGANWLLRQYYRVWLRNQYFANGKFGGVFGLSKSGLEHIGVLANVTNDDEYIRRRIPQEKVRVVEECQFIVRPPTTLSNLLAVRRRIHRGNRQLTKSSVATAPKEQQRFRRRIADHLIWRAGKNPALWIGLAFYIALNLYARVPTRRRQTGWERDTSSRGGDLAGGAPR